MSCECTNAQMLACRFGESLDGEVLSSAYSALQSCDLFMTIGTSSVVHPAAGFAAQVLSFLHSSNLHPLPSCPLSPVPCTLCHAPFALCPMACALCPMACALCPLPCALQPMPCALCLHLCPVPCTLCPATCALQPEPCALLRSALTCCLSVSSCHKVNKSGT